MSVGKMAGTVGNFRAITPIASLMRGSEKERFEEALSRLSVDLLSMSNGAFTIGAQITRQADDGTRTTAVLVYTNSQSLSNAERGILTKEFCIVSVTLSDCLGPSMFEFELKLKSAR